MFCIECIADIKKSASAYPIVYYILPIPGEAKAKAMPGWLYIQTINKINK